MKFSDGTEEGGIACIADIPNIMEEFLVDNGKSYSNSEKFNSRKFKGNYNFNKEHFNPGCCNGKGQGMGGSQDSYTSLVINLWKRQMQC